MAHSVRSPLDVSRQALENGRRDLSINRPLQLEDRGSAQKTEDCGARTVIPPEGESSSLAARRTMAGSIPASEAMASRSVRVGPSIFAGREAPWVSSSEARVRSRLTSSSV